MLFRSGFKDSLMTGTLMRMLSAIALYFLLLMFFSFEWVCDIPKWDLLHTLGEC